MTNQPICAGAPGNKGLLWIIGAFVICPCHLPITLAVIGGLLSCTALGALISGHPYVSGTLISIVWAAATWYGFRALRRNPE